jgi:hypothetical protein
MPFVADIHKNIVTNEPDSRLGTLTKGGHAPTVLLVANEENTVEMPATTPFSDFKKNIYRAIKYTLTRPSPPVISPAFSGPVVVVGSAPISNRPAGFNDAYRVITINGSQAVTKGWGIEQPDVTFIQFNQIEGKNTNAVEVRRVLTGQSTGKLFIMLWRDGLPRLEKGLKSFDYRYGSMEIVDRYSRMALIDKVGGIRGTELNADSKCSNGINAVLFALYNKAPAVIITGINPNAQGHVYNKENLARMHTDMDRRVLQNLLGRGYPVYTADPAVSEEVGIPLWTGKG